jgi:hypothetical protein
MTKPKPKGMPPLPKHVAAPSSPSSPKKTVWTIDDVALVERVGLSRPSALLLLGYLAVRKDPKTGEPVELPAQIEEWTTNLRRQSPWVWSALGVCDYVRMSRALDMCGLPSLTVPELQAAAGRMQALGDSAPAATA